MMLDPRERDNEVAGSDPRDAARLSAIDAHPCRGCPFVSDSRGVMVDVLWCPGRSGPEPGSIDEPEEY